MLTHLDLSSNKKNRNSIPVLHSYPKSNGNLLKEFVLDDRLLIEYFQEHKSSLLSSVKIINNANASLQADFLRKKTNY